MAAFELSKAGAAYNGKAVLRDISLGIERGERIALVGKSGAGKSTLLRLLYGSGQNDTALLPQDLGLVKTLSVFHNVYMGRLHRNSTWYNLANLVKPFRREIDSITEILRKLRLEEKIFVPAGELSGGQQQRTAVARALFQGSPAFLGDEPVSAVDEHQAEIMLQCINDAHETVVLAMHDADLAIRYTDRVIGIVDGHIVMDRLSAAMVASDLDDLYKS